MADQSAGRRWQVVGTGTVVAGLLEALDDPSLGVLLLTGPAGIGKTALARKVFESASAVGRPALRIVASIGATDRPYGALGRLLEVGGDQGATPAGGPRLDIAGSPSPGGRLLLVVDDLPLLDHSSAVEVAGLVRRADVVVLATARNGMALPAAVDGLDVEGRVVRQEVEPLGPEPLARAAEAQLGGPLSSGALDAVFARSGGIPLHARELVAANVAASTLVAGPDGWDIQAELLAPRSLFDLVASRFVRLDETTRRSVEALCLIQPLSVEAATALVGLDLLVGLEANDLVTVAEEVDAPTVRLAHPLYEESVLASLTPLRRRAAVERAVIALAPSAAEDPDLAYRLACLRVDHDLPIDVPDALAAAQRALGILDPRRAEQMLMATDDRSTEALLLLGAARAALGRTDEADKALADAWDAAVDDEQRARALSRRAGNLGPGAGRFDEAVRLMIDGLDEVHDPGWRAFLEADLAYLRSWSGERSQVAVNPTGSAPEVRANECLVGAIMAAMAGEVRLVEPLVVEGLTVVSTIERDVPHARDVLVLSRFLGRAFSGDAAGARAVADDELARSRSTSSGATGVWLSVRSLQALVDGDSHRALSEADEAIDRLILGDVAGLRPLALSVRAVACARLGDLAGSRSAAASIDPAWRDDVKVQVHLTQAAAWQEVVEGRTEAGVALLVEAGRVGLDGNHLPLGGLAAYDAVRLGHARSVLDLLRRIAERWEGAMISTILEHAELTASSPRAADRDVDRLVAVAEDLPRLGLTLAGVGTWAQVERAAAALGRDEVVRRAQLERARARLADVATPLADRPQILTERELEVARAVADGRTSREVAHRFGRSVRTVDNHLSSVYRKLGVSGRQELAPALDELERSPGQVPPTV